MLDVVRVVSVWDWETQHKKTYSCPAHGFLQILYTRSREHIDPPCLWIIFTHCIASINIAIFSEQEVQICNLIKSIGDGNKQEKEILTDLYRIHLDGLCFLLMRIYFIYVISPEYRKHLWRTKRNGTNDDSEWNFRQVNLCVSARNWSGSSCLYSFYL